ncbi:hypothetical protein ANN_07868 [Periplaneta americana]|uniref:Uncharacterized protein n=1 Tax=Periplaneta americana TaxID=6978 RepID=A0ABQ8T220_PERAM|nr:hypothetical protein ANN_07868 [Periplaneta americana]
MKGQDRPAGCWPHAEAEVDDHPTRMEITKIPNETIRNVMEEEETLVVRLEKRTLQWYGHVQRMPEDRWPKQILSWSPYGRKKRRRPRSTWRGRVARVKQERNFKDGDWQDRKLWRMAVGGNP